MNEDIDGKQIENGLNDMKTEPFKSYECEYINGKETEN